MGPAIGSGRRVGSIIRRVGYAIGSLSIAWLAVNLVVGVVFGPTSSASPLTWAVVVALGGLIYREIRSREVRGA